MACELVESAQSVVSTQMNCNLRVIGLKPSKNDGSRKGVTALLRQNEASVIGLCFAGQYWLESA